MWLMILMSGKWYARDYGSEDALRDDMDDAFILINEGTVVSICDDLESWCSEMGIEQDDVISAEVE